MAITEITLLVIPLMFFVIVTFITDIGSSDFQDAVNRMNTPYVEVPALGDWGATGFWIQNVTGTTIERFYGAVDLGGVVTSTGTIDLGVLGSINVLEHPELTLLYVFMLALFSIGFLLYILPQIVQLIQAVAEAIPF